MSSKGRGAGVTKEQHTRSITIITPHVLRFRRPILCQSADEPGASCASSECSRSPSPPRPCPPAAGHSRIVSLRCLHAAPYVAWTPVVSPSSPVTAASVATSPSADSDGGGTAGACLTSTGGQTWSSAALSPVVQFTGRTDTVAGVDTALLSMGCDVMEVVTTALQPESAPPRPGGVAEPTAGSLAQTPPPVGAEMPMEEATTPCPVTPLMGSQILSAEDIPLQDECVIDELIDETNQVIDCDEPDCDEPDCDEPECDEPDCDEPDGETMAMELFRCVGNAAAGAGDGLWSGVSAQLVDNCNGDDCKAEQTPDWKELTPQIMSLNPILFSGSSHDCSRETTPGCRCSLAASYNKKMPLDQHLNVKILPADPLSPPEDRGVPESKASVAIQQLISSVVPPISAELVQPRLYLDSEALCDWTSLKVECTQRPPTSGGDPRSPRPVDMGEALFLPSVGPAAEAPDSRLLPDGPAVVLTPGDVVQIEEPDVEPAAGPDTSARRGRGGRGRGRRARGGARRSAKTSTREARRASRGRGRGGRGRGRSGRGREGRLSAVREAAGELFVSADDERMDAWLAQTACARRDGDGDDPDGEAAALTRPPCQHFRRVVVGLSDLGPEPLAPTSKYQLWRRLSGTPEMVDVCHCLNLSYLVLEQPNGGVRYRCNICRKEFALQSSVRRHHRMVHDDERRYTCAECYASYFQLSDLKRHLLASHTDIKPFMCRLCGEQFARDADFRKHLTVYH